MLGQEISEFIKNLDTFTENKLNNLGFKIHAEVNKNLKRLEILACGEVNGKWAYAVKKIPLKDLV